MVSKEQLKSGILKYLDSEVLPNLPTNSKWAAGTLIVLATANYDRIFDKVFKSEPSVLLGISNGGELVDIDKLIAAAKTSSDKYGKVKISIPVVGTFLFSSEDIERLRLYITEEVTYDERTTSQS